MESKILCSASDGLRSRGGLISRHEIDRGNGNCHHRNMDLFVGNAHMACFGMHFCVTDIDFKGVTVVAGTRVREMRKGKTCDAVLLGKP